MFLTLLFVSGSILTRPFNKRRTTDYQDVSNCTNSYITRFIMQLIAGKIAFIFLEKTSNKVCIQEGITVD